MEFAGIGYSEEQIQLLDVASEFCREKSPIAKVRALLDSESGFDADVWKEIAELGWLSIAIPEAQGGVGLSLAEVVPVVEQMGRNLLASPFVSTIVTQQALLAAGSADQQAEWLPRLAAGEIGTLALGEAHGDWDLTNITATATRADGQIRLSGTKHFVLWADSAAVLLVSAILDGSPALVLVQKSSIPDCMLRREIITDETKRSFALKLDGISVSENTVLDVSRTSAALAQIELATNLLQSAEMCGGSQAVIDYTLSAHPQAVRQADRRISGTETSDGRCLCRLRKGAHASVQCRAQHFGSGQGRSGCAHGQSRSRRRIQFCR